MGAQRWLTLSCFLKQAPCTLWVENKPFSQEQSEGKSVSATSLLSDE